MPDLDTVAFVITTFNRRNLLERALASVLPQLKPDDFVIILDDHSTRDDTEAYSSQLALDNPQVIYHRMQENAGVNAARQQAIAVALKLNVNWISYIDDDDYLTQGVRENFSHSLTANPSLQWLAFPAIDEDKSLLSTFPNSGAFCYIEDYMGKRLVKGDYQHFLHLNIAKQCTFTRQFKNAEEWYFWCQAATYTSIYIDDKPGVVKEFLEEGITKSGFNREKQLEVAQLKVDQLKGKMSDEQYSKLLRNLGKAHLKSKNKKEARRYLCQAIKMNKALFSAYKYWGQSFL